MELYNRPRRLRRNQIIRNLVAETTLNFNGMIQPYFVCEGNGIKDEINGLPGIYRESVDSLVKSVTEDKKLGINNIMLFGVTERKDKMATSASDNSNPVINASRQLKDKFGDDLFVSADVCLALIRIQVIVALQSTMKSIMTNPSKFLLAWRYNL